MVGHPDFGASELHPYGGYPRVNMPMDRSVVISMPCRNRFFPQPKVLANEGDYHLMDQWMVTQWSNQKSSLNPEQVPGWAIWVCPKNVYPQSLVVSLLTMIITGW